MGSDVNEFKPPVLRLGKSTRTGIGGRKVGATNKPHPIECICRGCNKPKSPWKEHPYRKMRPKSDKQAWIDSLRIPVKLTVMRITLSFGRPGHIEGCTGDSEIWDLDEISGRHTMGAVPAALWPRDMQILRRCCHMLKTARGHVDYRSEQVRQALWQSSDLMVSLLPQRSGLNPYTKKDLSKAIRVWALRVSEDKRYRGNVTEAAL